ncbi:MAG: branched-chain amino acid ABC transporter permease [Rhodocyclaceae bacterium]|jgi:branched-chain amino acid transport system permease protein|nr:branched-chain amino acid ABC transporter permease [Rhodocyclaceae bacterium]
MSFELLMLAAADGFSYAGLLFLVSLGLTLIFGVQGILNVAHGSLYAFGGYTAATLAIWAAEKQAPTWVLLAALVLAALVVGVILGGILEIGLLRRVQDKDPVLQLLVTFAAFLIFEDLQRLIWGVSPYSSTEVVSRLGNFDIFGITYTAYQLLLIPAVAFGVYLGLLFALRRTRLGKQIIAVTHHREVATALGINARKIGLIAFIMGAFLGALGGALAAPTTSLVPGVGTDMIVLSFSVVATAGLGQITGALITALLIGLARSVAVYTVPELEVAVPYLIMVAVLLVRPNGLFTVAQARRI